MNGSWVSPPAYQLTRAYVDGYPVAVEQDHRWVRGDPGPVVATVMAPVELAAEDLVATLARWDATVEELAEDDEVRRLVVYTVVSGGCVAIEEARCELSAVEARCDLDPVEASYLAYCRERIAAVFGCSPAPVAGRSGAWVGGGLR